MSTVDTTLKKRPASWGNFIERFCTYTQLHTDQGKESLRRYLCDEFGLDYETGDDMLKEIDLAELDALTEKLASVRERRNKEGEDILSYNDALQVLRVYQKRKELREGTKTNPFGYRTWWLTQETMVRRATPDVIRKHNSQYMLRPEFVLNFIALAPSAEAVRKSFGAIFPTLLGVRLSNRMKADVFKLVIEKVREASQISDARARSLMSELSDKLKGDYFRRYEVELGAQRR
jgi:hypothetical protein